MINQRRRRQHIRILGFLLVIGLTACVPVSSTATDQSVETTATAELPVLTATQAPTATTPVPTVILVYGADADANALSQIRSTLPALAEQSGSVLVEQEMLLPEMLTDNIRAVVGIGPGLDLNGISSLAPDIAFIAVDDPNAAPSDNVFVIGNPAARVQHQAFMAGYLAAIISSDYKIGGLFSSETGAEVVDAFVIGAEFFCGTCRSSYPPYNAFPYWNYLSPGSSSDVFQATVDELVNYGVEVLYLQGELISAELLSYLADNGIKVVSDSPPDMARNNWIGTIASDPGAALTDLWEDALLGAVGSQVTAPVVLLDAEAGLVSDGRLRLFEEMAADLTAGLISTQYIP